MNATEQTYQVELSAGMRVPMTGAALRAAWAEFRVDAHTLVWREGWMEWVKVGQLGEELSLTDRKPRAPVPGPLAPTRVERQESSIASAVADGVAEALAIERQRRARARGKALRVFAIVFGLIVLAMVAGTFMQSDANKREFRLRITAEEVVKERVNYVDAEVQIEKVTRFETGSVKMEGSVSNRDGMARKNWTLTFDEADKATHFRFVK